ncbi:S-methyl-5-thioribose-1-phosphate isomerase [Pseudanabaena mucicola]|uniref:Methylthioribose-1-phosphate isomerase n=1 Tax=Pseudanabaena mucicola FACHB-723 TaxID=2692860 RepID=A0ABR7ZZM9_9CYAN|nr:S-methyl-5-thioribose-1-phosphate isomerase [Pseudanabaena mucicola]MBD2189352.1 S-methyl-5-thioribose-1-phosphate isomerase [Pseudanabaena mucicola FACHB-723]
MNSTYKAFWLKDGDLVVIDQTQLPFQIVTKTLKTSGDATLAIQDMTVRGAGVIGNVAAFGVYLAARESKGDLSKIKPLAAVIRGARPTAVNLMWAVDRMIAVLEKANIQKQDLVEVALAEAIAIADEDVVGTRNIGKFGCELIAAIANNKPQGKPVNILTHCNAGWLAIVDRGSALAPIYEAFEQGINIHVWVDETRPRNQGANLTAWELAQAKIPHTLITDNTGGLLMQYGKVDLCIVGTDRVTLKGDVANKIGTYLKALAAFDNQVPFYVALPSSTFDMQISDGVKEIAIETRSPDEVLYIQGLQDDGKVGKIRVAPLETPALNYGFDITPARLVTGLITERGICDAAETAIAGMFLDLIP